MPRVNIYLSDELADAVREVGVSVSAVCQRALEQEVRAMKAKAAATTDLDEVVARLAATVLDEEQETFMDGHEIGVEWARETATFLELRDLAEMDPRTVSLRIEEGEHSLFGYLGDYAGSSSVVNLEVRDPFTQGLIKGATEVYDAVKDRVWPSS